MHSKQGWRVETEDGEYREVRVNRVAGNWRFQSRMKGDPEWIRHDPPLLDDVVYLCEMMDRKYHRRRASLKTVEELQKLLREVQAKQRQTTAKPDTSDDEIPPHPGPLPPGEKEDL